MGRSTVNEMDGWIDEWVEQWSTRWMDGSLDKVCGGMEAGKDE